MCFIFILSLKSIINNMLRCFTHVELRHLRYFPSPATFQSAVSCKFERPLHNYCSEKLNTKLWTYSFCKLHTTSNNQHRFSASESGLNVGYTMEYKDVKEGLENKSLLLIDVRKPDELEKLGKIPGSINIPGWYIAWASDIGNFLVMSMLGSDQFINKNLYYFSCRFGKCFRNNERHGI